MVVEQVSSRAAQEQERRIDRLHQLLREVEQCLLRPVDVIEEHDHGVSRGERLHEPAYPPRDLLGRVHVVGEADHRCNTPARVGDVREQGPHPFGHDLGRIVLEDVCQSADRFRDRPVRDPFAVGEASADERGRSSPAAVEEPVEES